MDNYCIFKPLLQQIAMFIETSPHKQILPLFLLRKLPLQQSSLLFVPRFAFKYSTHHSRTEMHEESNPVTSQSL